MYKNYLMVLVLAVLICFGNCWQVFPLPDAPAPAVKAVDSVKPTPSLPKIPVVSSANEYTPNKFNVRPTSVSSVTKNVSVPATDLLPPKTEYVSHED
uniref:Uncharacterized protein n=1 Tax=Heliothis virescens TaxID=7102 RepID=A0A2A4JPJ6_HELVI